MSDWQLRTPVCFLIFKRPDTTKKVFEAIRKVKPPKLLVVADAPRPEIPGEVEKCLATRAIIDSVDWECEVIKNYAEVNMGCRHRVVSGLDWVFNTIEEAIILEDDCLPHSTFFRFCEELLEYYRYDERVMVISGNNFQFGQKRTEYSYYFSIFNHIWGWATWRRAWQHYDDEMKLWPKIKNSTLLKEILPDTYAAQYWANYFQSFYEGMRGWDYPWTFACWVQKGLSILPNVNLVSNIGFTPEATGDITRIHHIFRNLLDSMPMEAMSFPIQHQKTLISDIEADNFTQKTLFSLDWLNARKQLVNYWIVLAKEQLESEYLQVNISRIMNSKIRDELMMDTEEKFFNELSEYVAKGFNEPKSIQYLLVAMLYSYPHQLSLQYDLPRIPEWLVSDFLKYMLTPPIVLKEKGETDKYYQYMQQWVNYLHSNILINREEKLWQEVASFFTTNANFIQLYFNDKNLKDIYKKRADILEVSLKNQGHQINYEFPDRSLERKKIRLGVLAAHFGPQTETFTTLPAYKHLNRDLFEIILYTTSVSNHRLERYCWGHADAFITLPQDLPSQVQTIRDGDLDIILIATNVTAVTNSITLLALHRLARVQVASTSSCVTTGMRHVDYYISGQLTEPIDNAQAHYTEKLITVEGPAHCHDFATEEQLVSTIHVSRESLGIEPNEVVYISGANFYKIIPEVETAWAKIIATVPNSKLVLYPFNPNWSSSYPVNYFKKRILATFSSYGLSEDRLLILEPVPNRADVKERLKIADVYLDSYPFSGINSLLDPLEIGLPTTVMNGNSFRSLMGAALLQELQIPDLIADTEEAYIQLAIALGTNPELRQQKSDQIKERMQANPRFLDSRSYSAQMGDIFQKLFYKYQAETLTENFRLRETNLIIFPDWNQPEEVLYQDLAGVITSLVNHPDKTQITLLIHQGDLAEEEANLLLADITMNLLLEEDLDAADDPEISWVGQISEMQGEALIQRLQARIVLEHENKEAIAQVKAENIPSCKLDKSVKQVIS